MIELLPCPFCGSKNVYVDPDIESVTCDDCTATGPTVLKNEYDSDDAMTDAAIKAWNSRRKP